MSTKNTETSTENTDYATRLRDEVAKIAFARFLEVALRDGKQIVTDEFIAESSFIAADAFMKARDAK